MAKLSVLIAAQNPARRAQIRDLLRASTSVPLNIVEALDGVDMCNRASRQFFNFLVLDQNLEKRDGIAVLRAIQVYPRDLRPGAVLLMLANNHSQGLVFEIRDLTVECCGPEGETEGLRDWIARQTNSKPAGPVFDVKLVNAFIDSTIEVLQTTAKLSSTKEKIFIRGREMPSGDVSAVMAIQSSRQCGSMAISFEAPCFLGVVNRMLGEQYQTIDAEILDAVAELCSQIFGMAKRSLNESGYEIKPAIPSIIHAEKHRVEHKASGPCVAVRFATEAGHFTVEASLDRPA